MTTNRLTDEEIIENVRREIVESRTSAKFKDEQLKLISEYIANADVTPWQKLGEVVGAAIMEELSYYEKYRKDR